MAGEHEPVTVLGLGAMGRALAGAFLDAEYPATVWNRTANKDETLVARGARRAATVAEAGAASPLAVVCLLDDASVREVLGQAGDALSGRTLVNLTNGTPRQAREAAAWAAGRGVAYLDGGIMAVPPMIGSPEALLLYSGSRDAFEAHEETLGRLGTSRYLGADPGLAPLHDLALLSAMYGMFAGALHAVALVGAEGVEASEFTTSLLMPWLDAMASGLPHLAEQVDTADYTTGVVSNLAMQAAGFPNLMQASRDQGVRAELLAPLQALMDQAVADGHGAGDISALVEVLRKPAPAA